MILRRPVQPIRMVNTMLVYAVPVRGSLLVSILIVSLATIAVAQPTRRGLVMISIDGLRPDHILDADKHHLAIPNLRDILKRGAHASGVRGVLPTVTYPSHTTMLTGVAPAKHGILNNTTFDPLGTNLDGWYWYSEDIRVPTLWDAAARAGYKVGSVSWPVSAGTAGISVLIPEYWRSMQPDDLKLQRLLSTPGLLSEFEKKLGPYKTDLRDAVPADWARTRYAAEIIRARHARFITVPLGALDHIEHDHGPLSPEAFATLEEIDKMVGEIAQAMKSETPEAAICIVSDHGFASVDHVLNLRVAFVDAGLITPNPRRTSARSPALSDWKAQTWESAGSAMVMLKDPRDTATRDGVERLLRRLASNPENGIEAILDSKAIVALGGSPDAAFLVDMKSGFLIEGVMTGPLVTQRKPGGAHGYSPTHPELRASFLFAGPGVRGGADVGEIDMRSIAATLAAYLGVKLPTADLPALDIFTSTVVAPRR